MSAPHPFSRRSFLRWSLYTGASLTAAACVAPAPAANAPAAGAGATQLLTWSLGYGDEAFQRQLVEQFNTTHTDIQLAYDPALAGLDLLTEGMQKLRIALENKSGPDLVGGIDVGAALEAVVASEQVMDLTDVYKEYGWDQRIPQSLIDHVTIEGKIYAVPQSVETVGLFYNITLFEQLGLSVPTTFDEYMAVLQALKDAGYYGYAIGLAGGWPSAFMASEFMYLSAGSEYAKVLSGEIPWTESPKSLQGLTAFHEIVAGGYSNPDVLGIDQDQANDLFFQGQTATTLNTNGWIGSVLIAKPEFETGFFYLPPIDPATDVKSLGGIGGSLIVTKSTPNPDAALQVIDWLLAPEQVRTVFTGAGDIPPVDFELPEDTDPLLRQIATETIANAGNVGFWPVTYLAPQVFSQLNALVQGMMGGQLTPEQVLEEMQKAHETYIKEKGA